MKVLLINGSPHEKGCTYTALSLIAGELKAQGIETEILHVGGQPVGGCIGCGGCRSGNGCVFGGVVNEAIEKVAMFEAMYSEYAQNPAITRTRMYYEAISQVLPGVKLYINTGGQGGDVQMLLPLESLAGTEGGNAK